MYRYISRESCSQFDSLPLTSLVTGGSNCAQVRELTLMATSRRALPAGATLPGVVTRLAKATRHYRLTSVVVDVLVLRMRTLFRSLVARESEAAGGRGGGGLSGDGFSLGSPRGGGGGGGGGGGNGFDSGASDSPAPSRRRALRNGIAGPFSSFSFVCSILHFFCLLNSSFLLLRCGTESKASPASQCVRAD
jgi:hypothetical protein